jgi:hypothetical protein
MSHPVDMQGKWLCTDTENMEKYLEVFALALALVFTMALSVQLP